MGEGGSQSHEAVTDLNAYLAVESDPKLRALASLIYTVAKSNADTASVTTKAIVSMSNQLEAHLTAFEKHTAEELENAAKSRGVRKALSVVAIVGNLILGGAVIYVYKDYGAMSRNIDTMKAELITTRKAIDEVSKKLED